MRWLTLALPLLFFTACDSGHDQSGHPHDGAAAASGEKVKDPICKMDVSKATARKAEFDKADYYFCSEECLKKFIADPAKYAQACTCAKTMKHCDCGHCAGKREPCDCAGGKK
jgi:YHS domain-containing protein